MRATEFICENQLLAETISSAELTTIGHQLDLFYEKIGVGVKFTRHFLDRCNDPRNGKEITVGEVMRIFRNELRTYGSKIAEIGPAAEGIFKDLATKINVAFVLNRDQRTNTLDLVAKNIMRKSNYHSSHQGDTEFPIR